MDIRQDKTMIPRDRETNKASHVTPKYPLGTSKRRFSGRSIGRSLVASSNADITGGLGRSSPSELAGQSAGEKNYRHMYTRRPTNTQLRDSRGPTSRLPLGLVINAYEDTIQGREKNH